ncbi:hypothetical protein Lal_00024837 [Lupinus albus]|uniref:Putative RNA recognition motif domain-containing protein n=1 Tax=Lupinus albus TaxID=3870 RepID=A0A6A5NWU1_LUPAL|nr:putative RNA recognition motif domain-containing protein [Lupinus albus]KAF1889510.1 hypothetical protein Lal_00024837 [Lupinus albus]
MMENSIGKSSPSVDAAIPSLQSPKQEGKREGEDDLEKLACSKKRKRDEVAEKQKNVSEIRSDDSSLYSEQDQDQKSAKNGTPENEDNPDTRSNSSEYSGGDSDEDKAVMDIDQGDNSEESDAETQKKKMKTLQCTASNSQKHDSKTVVRDTSSDISDGDDGNKDNDDDDSSDDRRNSHMVEKPVKDSENLDENDEEVEEKSSRILEERPRTSATLKVQIATSKKICVRNLSYSVERADMENLFKECGEIVDVRFITDSEGRFKGFGYILFATEEAALKALELDNTELLRHPIRIVLARERSKYTLRSSNFGETFQSGASVRLHTIFVAGFNKSLTEEKIKTSLEEHFSSCGEITRISIPKYPDSVSVKGYAHLDFKDFGSYNKALQLNKTEIGGYYLSVEKAMPRRQYGGRDGGGYQHGWRDGGGRQYGERDGGGRQYGGRDGGEHQYGGRRDGGGHQFCGRDGGGYRHNGSDGGCFQYGWRGYGGGHQYGGRDGGGYLHRGRDGVGLQYGGRWGGGGHQYGGRDAGGHQYGERDGGGRQYDGRDIGGQQYGGRDIGSQQYGGRDIGGHQYGGRDGGVRQYGWRDGGGPQYGGNGRGGPQYGGRDGGGHQYGGRGVGSGHGYGGRDGGGRGMRSWGRSGDSWRQ